MFYIPKDAILFGWVGRNSVFLYFFLKPSNYFDWRQPVMSSWISQKQRDSTRHI